MSANTDGLQPPNNTARPALEQARLQVVTTPAPASLQFMLQDLAKSGLVPEDIQAAPINLTSSSFVPAAVGYRIPYFTVEGQRHARMYRERLADASRYRQPSREEIGDDCLFPYIPSAIHTMDCSTIAICEGEKKAASVLKHLGIPAIGIGGCSNWRERAGKQEVHPAVLALFDLRQVRRVLIIPDADVQRYDIAKEYGTFATLLKREGYDVELRNPPGKIDDLIVKWGEHAQGKFGLLPRVPTLVENARSLAERYGLAYTQGKDGGAVRLEQNESNVLLLLRMHPAFPNIWYNADTLQIMFDDSPTSMDHQGIDVLAFLQHNLQMPKVNRTTVRTAIARRAFDDTRSPFREWLDSLRWDGVPRLEKMFPTYCGSPDTEFTKEVGRKWLPGAVWRTMEPGCPIHYMLITRGAQGRGKSTFPTILWGKEHVVTILGKEGQHKDDMAKFHMGKCVSFEEFDTMHISNIGHLKGVITNPIDTFRKPYDADTKSHARSCVFYASTNKKNFLKHDDSGYRRFVVVPLEQLKFAALAADREQLWAEAVVRFRELETAGLLYELSEIEGTNAEAAQYVNEEDYIERWEDWLASAYADTQQRDGYQYVKTSQIYENSGARTKADQAAIMEYVKETGWVQWEKSPTSWGTDGKRLKRIWVRKMG